MSRATRSTPAGRAFLDLQNRARAEKRGTQEFLTLYVVERWLARLGESPYLEQFVVKGGVLLAAFDARRPTADLDALARNLARDQSAVSARVARIALQPSSEEDGVEFLTGTMTSRVIRDDALYSGVRVAMDCAIATAQVKFRLDVNFGDPVTPGPVHVCLPALRPGMSPVRVLGYPIETVLAEKITTAIGLGPANTRVRDYADIYAITGNRALRYDAVREALRATAAFRGVALQPLSSVTGDLAGLRQQTYAAYRASLGPVGGNLPEDFALVINAVAVFADGLVSRPSHGMTWNPRSRRWEAAASRS